MITSLFQMSWGVQLFLIYFILKMKSTFLKNVCPVAFLLGDMKKCSRVIVPFPQICMNIAPFSSQCLIEWSESLMPPWFFLLYVTCFSPLPPVLLKFNKVQIYVQGLFALYHFFLGKNMHFHSANSVFPSDFRKFFLKYICIFSSFLYLLHFLLQGRQWS